MKLDLQTLLQAGAMIVAIAVSHAHLSERLAVIETKFQILIIESKLKNEK